MRCIALLDPTNLHQLYLMPAISLLLLGHPECSVGYVICHEIYNVTGLNGVPLILRPEDAPQTEATTEDAAP